MMVRELTAGPATPQHGMDAVEFRLHELETDRLRLQRLVSELLIKNQKLRESLTLLEGNGAASTSGDKTWS